MKRGLYLSLGFLLVFIVVCWAMGQSGWHRDRNQYNALPLGKLTQVQDSLYRDSSSQPWILLPASMNAFHQPAGAVKAPVFPYRGVISGVEYDPEHPNLKLLQPTNNGGSLEAILQPDGTYLTTGPRQGTYNYGHPAGFWGILKHTLWDVLPHFANGNYQEFPTTEGARLPAAD